MLTCTVNLLISLWNNYLTLDCAVPNIVSFPAGDLILLPYSFRSVTMSNMRAKESKKVRGTKKKKKTKTDGREIK